MHITYSISHSSYCYVIDHFQNMVRQVIVLAVFLTCASSQPTRQQRLTLAQWGSYNFRDHKGPGTYAFGYDIEDPATNNIQFRQEERHLNGTVVGSYGYVEPSGHVRIHHYVADENGYRVTEENPGPSQLHPHHDPPTTTTPNPVIQQEDEYFEGEFYPTADQVSNVQDNTKPIQFPPFTFPQQSPPVFEDQFFWQQQFGNNDALSTHFLAQNHRGRIRNLMPIIVYRNPYGGQLGWLRFRV